MTHDPSMSEEALGLAFQACPSAMLLVSGEGTITMANAQAEALFGYGHRELVGKPLEILLPLPVRAQHPAHMAAFLANPSIRAMGAGRDLTGLRRDGTEVPIEIGLNPLPMSSGNFVLAFVIDISHRKQLEANLRLSEARQRQIVEGAPNAMIMVDGDGVIVSVNPQAELLFGHPRDRMVGQSVDMLVPTRFRDQHPLARAAYSAQPVKRPMGAGRDLHGLRADGSEVPIEIGLNPLVTSEGMFVLAAIIDITERKRSEDLLRASLDQKETLLREIHHRVKNNMQVVSSLLSLQSARIPAPEYKAVLHECQRRVLTMALIHEKLYASGTASIDCGSYVRDLTQMAMTNYASLRGTVDLDLHLDRVEIHAQTAIPIGLIVHEIVTNALKHAFTAMGRGRLRVTLRAEPDGEVCLSIQDDGPGLPSPSNPLSAGSMGMQIVHSLARQIDGTVSTESGNGTTFHVRFRSPDFRTPHTDTHTKGR